MIRVAIALAAVIIALGGLSVSLARDRGKLHDQVAAHRACTSAVFADDLGTATQRCPPEITAVLREAVQAEVCERALLAGELFVVRSACSGEVKTLFAAREAESRRADSLAEILDQTRREQAAIITRAEIRVRSEVERKYRAEAALSSAPRVSDSGGGGLLVLNAGLLRQLRGEDAAAAPDQP